MKNNLFTLLLTIFLVFVFNTTTLCQLSCIGTVYVSKTGSDQSTCGTVDSPCLTINYAINRAEQEGFNHVKVGIGTYAEVVVLKNGISLWGGFAEAWIRTNRSTISGGLFALDNEFVGLKADNITSLTVVSDFNILSPNASTAGKSSYGMHSVGSTGLQIQNCDLIAGNGVDGTVGTAGTDASSTPAQSGGTGAAGIITTALCDDQRRAGGPGGTNTEAGSASSGGEGGSSGSADTRCVSFPNISDYTARAGLNGSSALNYLIDSYGYRGVGGGLCTAGSNGNDGRTINGIGGLGASTSGIVSGNYWQVSEGQDGTLGEHGTGGGGGGGAGGCDEGFDNTGSGGGGGGAGGIRAPLAGSGGMSGGSSFGMFIVNSIVKIISCNISGGMGGSGGNGGNGGLGQLGGSGGLGGINVYSGGNGGKGGNGGVSGAGGGGAGGSSFALYGVNSTVYSKNSTLLQGTGGAKGNGGLVENANGSPGVDGTAFSSGGSTLSLSVDNDLTELNNPCTILSTSENLFDKNSLLRIFPNPFSESTTIEFPNETGEPFDLIITDMSGNIIRIINKISESTICLEQGNLPIGYYIIELRGSKTYKGKLIIK